LVDLRLIAVEATLEDLVTAGSQVSEVALVWPLDLFPEVGIQLVYRAIDDIFNSILRLLERQCVKLVEFLLPSIVNQSSELEGELILMCQDLLAPATALNYQGSSIFLKAKDGFGISIFSLLEELLVDLIFHILVSKSLFFEASVDACSYKFQLRLEGKV
jgi:hypothetical protein